MSEVDMGEVVVRQHYLPPGVPADAEPITEDQLERLPDYVQQLIGSSMENKLPATTAEELVAARAAFFSMVRPTVPPPVELDGAAAASNSTTEATVEMVEESMENTD